MRALRGAPEAADGAPTPVNGSSAAVNGTPTPAPVLDIRGLEKRFFIHAIGRQVDALRRVDLAVGPGEHVVLVGASGAGKSTLLKCVWRSCLPTAGEVLLRRADGTVVDLARADDRTMVELRDEQLGYVSQFLGADQRRSVHDVVVRSALKRGLAGDEAGDAAAGALRQVGLGEELWATRPVVLSGGEQQRVNLAIGTLRPPGLLLLDEPVASLDATNREAVLELIAGVARTGVSVLSVFHDLDAVRRLATRVVLLEAGRVAAEGEPGEILEHMGVLR